MGRWQGLCAGLETGRIGVKLTDEAKFENLMDVQGAAPWKAGPKTMSHWILVPEGFHGSPKKLSTWVAAAHEMALASEAKPAKKKVAAKKNPGATKKPVAKKKATQK